VPIPAAGAHSVDELSAVRAPHEEVDSPGELQHAQRAALTERRRIRRDPPTAMASRSNVFSVDLPTQGVWSRYACDMQQPVHQCPSGDDFPQEDRFRQGVAAARAELKLAPGDLYEDCAFHPVVCVEVDYDLDEISGVSMIDGSHPRSCSLRFCGVRKLTIEEAWRIKRFGPGDDAARDRISVDKRWW
jgi:hypothetical protein